VTEVVSVPTGLRPGAVAGVPLSALVAQVDAALTDGTAVIQWSANNGANQRWTLIPAS